MTNSLTNLKDVAKHFKVSNYEIRKWKNQGCAALKEALYDLGEIEEWRDLKRELIYRL